MHIKDTSNTHRWRVRERENCNWSLAFLFKLVYVYRRIDINRVHTTFISFALIFSRLFTMMIWFGFFLSLSLFFILSCCFGFLLFFGRFSFTFHTKMGKNVSLLFFAHSVINEGKKRTHFTQQIGGYKKKNNKNKERNVNIYNLL